MSEEGPTGRSSRHFWLTLALLGGVLAVLFFRSFLPGQILFSNDAPLGEKMAAAHRLPAAFTGVWWDLNSLGSYLGLAGPGLATSLEWLSGPVGYAKFYAPLALLLLGLGAWCFFRQLRLAPAACVLGALAAMLNSAFFSDACWGMGPHEVGVGMMFLAMAALADDTAPQRWVRVVLAGIAVGMGVCEALDEGGLLSLCVGAFVLCQAWVAPSNAREPKRLGALTRSLGRLAVVVLVALCLAAQSIIGVATTALSGTVRMGGDVSSPQAHWDWATQWSLPKVEALGLAAPGLFGYRMDARGGGGYWGAIGRAPAWDRYFESGKQGPAPQGMLRYSGGGNYAGILVLAVALWAALGAWRKTESVFLSQQKKWIWFWSGLGLAGLLLAFGRFAPFYKVFYALPYFGSAMRNPVKFVSVFSFALVIVFAYGTDGLLRCYLSGAGAGRSGNHVSLRTAWAKLAPFDRAWLKGALVVLEIGLAAWVVYVLTRGQLAAYLQDVDFDAAEAKAVAAFSVRQAGWALVFWTLAFGLMALVLAGCFRGRWGRAGAMLLGVLLIADLGRANLPWIVYWDYPSKYQSNPVIETLRDHPFEHRVSLWRSPQLPEFLLLDQFYHIEWMPHHFPYYNIQALDIVQMWSKPADLAAFENALRYDGTTNTFPRLVRRWQLTNTRYVLGATAALADLNRGLAPEARRFRILRQFEILPRPGIAMATRCEELTTEFRTNGHYAIFEYTGALPRAKLYSAWEVNTNSAALLERLVSPAFDPEQTLLLSQAPPFAPGVLPAASADGKVEFVSYAPKDIVLKTEASTATVLLLNDGLQSNWKVSVDDRPAELLRCNYLMRGVALGPGTHRVEFRFAVPMVMSWVKLAILAVGVVLCGILYFSQARPREGEDPDTPPSSS